MNETTQQCPCCSGKEYAQCCHPFHKGEPTKNALELMRSRYTAYVLNLPDYIVATTHPASPQYMEDTLSWKRGISQFSTHTIFEKLEVRDFRENEKLATVTFTAYIKQNEQDNTFTETSYFEKIHDRWLYRNGLFAQGRAPDQTAADLLQILPLAYYGDPVLRKKADLVPEITDEIRQLVEEMVETMDASRGVGLAAPQVHHSLRLFVIRDPIETEDGSYEMGDVRVFINPKLSLPSKEKWTAPEACLSIPTLRSDVERPKEITVEYTSLDGTVTEERFSGWAARVVMHENDHINGVLFIDRLNEKERSKLNQALHHLEQRIQEMRENKRPKK